MKKLFIVLILLSIPCAASGQTLFRAAQVGYIGANALDLYSTKKALDKGYIEANPFLPQSIRGIAITKSIVGVGTIALSEWLYRKGNKKLAYTSLIVGSILPIGAFVHNTYVIEHGTIFPPPKVIYNQRSVTLLFRF